MCASLLLGTTLFAQTNNSAQDSTALQELEEVVVSDSRFALKRENSGKTVISINAEEISRNQGKSVAELINTRSGIVVNGSRSNAGQNISVFTRGGNNRQVLVIIDGIQVSDPSNVNAEYDLRQLALSQIERIEILKGAASTLYGNAAATTVINITTKKATAEGVSLETISTFATNNAQINRNSNISDVSNTVSISARKNNLSVFASGGHQFTDGLSAAIGDENDSFSRINGNLKLGYDFSERFQISASAFYNKIKSDFDNGFPVEDADFSFFSEQSRFGLSSKYTYANGSINFNGAFNQIARSFDSSFPSAFNSESLVFDVYNKYTFDKKFYTILGLNIIENRTLFTEEQQTTTVDPYANVVYVSDFGLNINAGARLNISSDYGTNAIYNLNPSYRLKVNEGYLKFFGTYATSFIAPNLSQLFGPFGANPDLDPEEDTTIEGGVEYRPFKNFRISALYFNRREENRIQFVTIDPDTFESQFQNNPGTADFDGIEVELEISPINNLQVSANYTYTNAEEGLSLRIPENVFNASVNYSFAKNTNASVSYQQTSSRDDLDFNTFENVVLENYGILSAYIGHRFNQKISVFANIENITNTDYLEISNFTTRGVNFRVGVQLSL